MLIASHPTAMKRFVPLGGKVSYLLLLIGLSLALAGCDDGDGGMPPEAGAMIAPTAASGSDVTGTAVFSWIGDHVLLVIDVADASPGIHAVHIHETGDCSAADGTSAGGHWNPDDVGHGRWGSDEFHLGDLGNIAVGEDGTGYIERTTDLWEIGTGSDWDVVGKAIIVHAGADDFTSQPSGAAGPRIGCGVIELQ